VLASALSDTQWAALAVATKDAKDHLAKAPKGLGQAIDFAVRVTGTLDVNENSSARASDAPDLLLLLAHAVERLPKAKRKDLVQALAERYAAAAPISQETTDMVEALKKSLTTSTIKPRRGVITGLLEMAIIPVPSGRRAASTV
jgi:hypothetical protein